MLRGGRGRAVTRLLATATLAAGVAWSPPAPAAPAAGAIDYLQFDQVFAGTDGYRWVLGGTAYVPHGAASTADSALLLWLNSCHNADLWRCQTVGRWRVPLPSSALHIASDDSTAALNVVVGGLTLAVDAVAPSTAPAASYNGESAGGTIDPTHPDFDAGESVAWPAAGTVSIAGLRCTKLDDPMDAWILGTFVGGEASGGSFAGEASYDQAAPARGLAPGFLTGHGYRPACLTERQAPPNSGVRLVTRGGPVVGSFRVEKHRQLTVTDPMFTPTPVTGDVNGLLLVKPRGKHQLIGTRTFYASGQGGLPASSWWAPVAPLAPGDYTFALWSDRGATLWFPPGTVRRLTVEPHPRATVGRKVISTAGLPSEAAAQWLVGAPLNVGRNTYAVMQGTLVKHTSFAPPVTRNSMQVCFKAATAGCSQSGPVLSSGDDIGPNFDPNYNPLRHPDVPGTIWPFTAVIGLPFNPRPAPGSYDAAMSYQGTDSTDTLDLDYLAVDLP